MTTHADPPATLAGSRGGWPAADRAGGSGGKREAAGGKWRRAPVLRWSAAIWLITLIVLMANQPGRMVFDTKLPIDLDPASYFAGLWHLWDPLDNFGTINNQAIGYAVPMAPFYLAGQLAHVPVWLTERMWMSLIVAIAFAGLVKLAAELGVGSASSRFVAGLTYALWPTFTIVIGSTSAAVLPGVLAPWAVLPLVPVVLARAGNPSSSGASRAPGQGWRAIVWAAARSGAVVLCMGGVNATSTLDVLLLPGLFILTYARGRRLVALCLAWGAAVVAATLWWAVPLLLQGKYAFDFLPYVEQAATTTSATNAATILRGAGNWTAYLNIGSPWLPAGWAMVPEPAASLAAAAAAALGLAGLARRSLPGGTWLRLAAAVAAAGALAGYSGPLGDPAYRTVQHLLDGTLAPFRNVYKQEPVIAVALALGLAHVAVDWLAGIIDMFGESSSDTARWAWWLTIRLGVCVLVAGLAVPYLSDEALNPGSFTAIPRYWYQVAAYLAANSPQNPALVVPGDAHGKYLWGDPIDDPLVALATSPWAERSLVPYSGAGSQILLQTAENAVESGEEVPGLAAYLERAGIGYIVVRNDLDPRQIGYTSPEVVHRTLALSGFTRVASFGPLLTGAQTDPDASPGIQVTEPDYPSVEVYVPAGTKPSLSPVAALPLSQTMLVNGGPDSLLQLAGQNLLSPDQATVIAGDRLPATPTAWAATDGLPRTDTAFGLINSNVSFTYTATETNPPDDQLGDAAGPPRQLLPVPAAGHQTVAELSGAAQVSVSSYGSWLGDTQQDDPASAFDDDPATAWAEGGPTPVGQWIQITFDHPMRLPATVGIRLLDDNPAREIASSLRVSTAAGSVTTRVAATGSVQQLHVSPGLTSSLRITITGASRLVSGGAGAGISDVLILGVHVTRLLRPAQDPAGENAQSFAFSFHQQVPSPLSLANPASVAPLARTFTTSDPASLRLSASALAVPGPGLDSVLDQTALPGKGVLQVSVAATTSTLPGTLPQSLLTGGDTIGWLASTPDPVIHMSWQGKRRIKSIVVQPAQDGASIPETVRITSPAGVRQGKIGPNGLVVFKKPLVTDRIDMSFPSVQQASMLNSAGQPVTLPLGLSRLSVPALAGLQPAAPDATAPFSLACGQGPVITVDGHAYQTAVSGTLGALTQYLPVRVRLCSTDGALPFGAGQHTVTVAAPGAFEITDLSLTGVNPGVPVVPAAARATGERTVTVRSWQSDQRRVSIGPGAATYLEVHENYNAGWSATLDGYVLTAVRLDGWQQAFVVPAGAGGSVVLTYKPATAYHLALIASAAAIGVLLLVVAWSFAARRRRDGPGGAGAAGIPAPSWPADTVGKWLGTLGVIGLLFLAGGPVVLAGSGLVLLAWRCPRLLPAIAFCGMAAAGVLTATAAHPSALGHGAFSGPAQATALVAFGAALIPVSGRARPRSDGDRRLARLPFGLVDEIGCYFDSPAEPNNIQLEAWLPGRLDKQRLRAATAAVMAARPRARVRRAAHNPWDGAYAWVVPPQAGHDPVIVVGWLTDAELELIRTRFFASAPPLDQSPPFELLLARGPEQDCLMLNTHHAALDGISCLRLLTLIAAEYGGDRPSSTDEGLGTGTNTTRADVTTVAVKEPARAPAAARVASQHAGGRSQRHAPGYGFRLLSLPSVPATAHGTVNDLLVATLIETIRQWNATRGSRANAARPVRISVPADARQTLGGELGNLSRLCTVTAAPAGPTGQALVAAVAEQTRQAKSQDGPQVSATLAAMTTPWLPVEVKRRALRVALRTAGWRASDTTLLSNLGNVPAPPAFGSLVPDRMWFSGPAHMPRGLSVGAITIDGRLQLCFRYRHALFDDAAAAEFAARYAAVLATLSRAGAEPERVKPADEAEADR
jgi:arabinofuranan 3-O-arabinosyltransferase